MNHTERRLRGSLLRGCVLAVVLAAAGPAALAAMPGDVPEKWRLNLGGMFADAYTEGALSENNTGLGATISFEDTFNLPEEKSVVRIEGAWRVAKRQHIDFGYLEINRTGTARLEEDVEWGDYVFLANGEVTAGFDTSFPYAAWRYSFLDIDEVRISGSAGLSYMGLSAYLEASGNVTDANGNPVSGSVDEEVSIDFPVPMVGLQLDWALTRRLMLQLYARGIFVDGMGIRGSITDDALRLHWFFSKHVGMSGGIDRLKIDLKEYDSGETKAKFRYEVTGLALYLDLAF